MKFDLQKIRKDFPIFEQTVNDEPLVYLDNAATTQKPKSVIQSIQKYYEKDNANVHRGVHTLTARATEKYEGARETVRAFINAGSVKEILFTRGTTTSLNWVARFAEQILQPGDEILISIMEHHSNLVPWQEAAKKTGAILRFVYLTKEGRLDLADFDRKLTPKTRFVSLTHVSNVLGVVNPIKELAQKVHQVGAYFVVDGAQAAPHFKVDVKELEVDFYAFSGHKMLGPTGIGVLYGRRHLLELMDPVEFGGEMIDFVYEDHATWTDLPWKFEAGTPLISEAISLGRAIKYLNAIGLEAIHTHEQELLSYTLSGLTEIDGIEIYGPRDLAAREGVLAFNLRGLHPHDLATALDLEGIAIRAGHHCAQPLLNYLGVPAMARASFYLYNTLDDCTQLIEAIQKAKKFFEV